MDDEDLVLPAVDDVERGVDDELAVAERGGGAVARGGDLAGVEVDGEDRRALDGTLVPRRPALLDGTASLGAR